jgi:hypothetical protein
MISITITPPNEMNLYAGAYGSIIKYNFRAFTVLPEIQPVIPLSVKPYQIYAVVD